MNDEYFQRLLAELADGEYTLPELSEKFDLTALTDDQLSEIAATAEFEVALHDYVSDEQPFSATAGQKLAKEIDSAHFVRDAVVATAADFDSRRRSQTRLALVAMASIAGLALCVSAGLFLFRSTSPEVTYTPSDDGELDVLREVAGHVATIVRIDSDSEQELSLGRFLQPGVIKVPQQGSIDLLFRSGTLATLTGPGRLELLSADSAFLHLGELSVNTGNRDNVQFTVHTTAGQFIDRGTAFGLAIDPKGAAQLHVFEGTVGLEPVNESSPRRLIDEGQSLTVDASGLPVVAPATPAPRPLSVEIQPFNPPQGYRELIHQNGAPLIHLDFQEEFISGATFHGAAEVVREGSASSLNLPPLQSESAQGLIFEEPIQVPVDGDLSVEVWICHPIGGTGIVASLSNKHTEKEPLPRHLCLLSLAEWRSEGIASYRGKPRATFRLGWPKGTSAGDHQRWLFGQDLYLDHLTVPGQWTHLAATYSDGMVRFYRDGVLQKEASAPRPNHDQEAILTIGQLNPWQTQRHFSGMIDEFAIHARELSAEEIRERVEWDREK